MISRSIIDPGVISFVRTNVVIECAGEFTRGMTVVDLKGVTGRPANADVAVNVDTARLWKLFGNALKRLP